jgi:hypothetical protein
VSADPRLDSEDTATRVAARLGLIAANLDRCDAYGQDMDLAVSRIRGTRFWETRARARLLAQVRTASRQVSTLLLANRLLSAANQVDLAKGSDQEPPA